MTDSGGDPAVVGGTDRRWAWIAVLFGAWIVGGVYLVSRALNMGDATDAGLSPYHVVGYGGLIALAAVSIWLVIRARRRGLGWRHAYPAGLGSLGAGVLVLLAYVVVDVAWREGVGIGEGIESGVAPSRVLLTVGLALVAMAPLRASLLAGGDRGIRWQAAVSAGLLTASIAGLGGLNPIVNPWLERAPDVVEDNGEVWLMDADGGRQTRLLEAVDGVDLALPVWSPDGSQIAYSRFEGRGDDPATGNQDIWVANADGTGARPFATGLTWQWFPRWSPDGAWIGYTEEAAGGPWLSSGPVGPDLGQGPQGPAFPGANAVSRPEADLWRLSVDGGPAMRITDVAGDDRSGSWSPDGARLAFDSTRDGNTEIYVVGVDGSNATRLTTTPGEDWAASWSPDGTRIAFTSDRSGTAQIWTMLADGTGVSQITEDRIGGLWPSWSPDGERIAYTSWQTGSQQVWSVRPDGSDPVNLSRSGGNVDSVWDGSWGPDGRIAFTRVGATPAYIDPLAREDLGVAVMLLSALALALIVALLVRTRPPFGAVALAMGIAATLEASQFDAWRFVPAAVVAGLLVDVVLRLVPAGRQIALGASASAVGLVGAVAVTLILTTGIGWSPTLLLGVAFAVGVAGWAIGAVVERHAGDSRSGDASTKPAE